MSDHEPSYQEYLQATSFARFRYKYGLFVMIASWFLFLFLIFYLVYNGEAVARHPLIYGADKYNVSCICFSNKGSVLVNESSIILWADIDSKKLVKINFSR